MGKTVEDIMIGWFWKDRAPAGGSAKVRDSAGDISYGRGTTGLEL
jgi:hypothetical protein